MYIIIMPTMNGEGHRVITFDDEEVKDLFNGDENFAKQLSEEYIFYWFDAKFSGKYFMKGITTPDKFDKMFFFEITGDGEGLIQMKNKIDEILLEYNLFTYITLNYSGKLYN